MPLHYLIVVEVGFVVLASWAIGVLALRALRRSRDNANEQVVAQKAKVKALREKLAQAQATIAALQMAQAADTALDAGSDAEDSIEDLGALIIDLDESMTADSQSLDELGGIQTDLFASMERLGLLQEPVDISAWDAEAMRLELAQLREQSSRSGRVINELTKALESSRAKVREIEKSNRRRYSQQINSTRDESEKTIRRLTRDNRTLQTRWERELASHQSAIERITTMLRESDEKYRNLVRASKEEKFSMSAAIEHLRQQLSAATDKSMSEEQTKELLARLREMDEALARSKREREFLDARFVELEEALEQAEVVYEELNRTKAEYRMLEERFLRMETEGDESTGATSAEKVETDGKEPGWQSVPETPETVAFDHTVLNSLAPESSPDEKN